MSTGQYHRHRAHYSYDRRTDRTNTLAESVILFIAVFILSIITIVAVSDALALPERDNGTRVAADDIEHLVYNGADTVVSGVISPSGNPHGARVVFIDDSSVSCSGIPIRDTNMFVTSAHCLLRGENTITFINSAKIFLGEGYSVSAIEARIPAEFISETRGVSDVAVLYTEQRFTWGANRIGIDHQSFDAEIYGAQYFDENNNHVKKEDEGRKIRLFGECKLQNDEIVFYENTLLVPCSMFAGSSGGPMLVIEQGEVILAGVISTIREDGYNVVVNTDRLEDIILGHGSLQVSLNATQ